MEFLNNIIKFKLIRWLEEQVDHSFKKLQLQL